MKYYKDRLKKKNKKQKTHLLCAGLYISRSEALHQYDNYSPEVDKKRLKEMFQDDEEVDYLQKVNEYSQVKDYGGWRTRADGSPARQKIHRDSDGDYYICPYCSSYRFCAEVENKGKYRWDCCDQGTLRTLIELEKVRPHSKFAKYFVFLFSHFGISI